MKFLKTGIRALIITIFMFCSAVLGGIFFSATASGYDILNAHGDNVVGSWYFDEGSGSTAYDSSENGNDGTIYGATWSNDGMLNGSMYFDGSDDYVNIPNDSSLQLTDSMTIMVWIRFESGGNWNPRIIHKQRSYQIFTEGIYTKRYLKFAINQDPSYIVTSSFQLRSDIWYHIGATYDKSEMRLYINGELDNSLSYSGNIAVNTYPVRIGSNSYNGLDDFKGNIDEIYMLNKSLNSTEINDYFSTFNYSIPVPVIKEYNWKFDEGSGQYAYDESDISLDLRLGSSNSADSNDPAWTNTPFGKGLNFDGNNDYAISESNINITGNTSRTMAAWFYVDDFTTNWPDNNGYGVMQVISWGTHTGTSPVMSQLMVGTKYKRLICNGNYAAIYSAYDTIQSDTWYHAVFTYDGYHGYLYLDGELIGTNNFHLNTENTSLRVGLRPSASNTYGGWNAPFNGIIDEVLVSSKNMN